uniref:ZP domain-containing protein n=1 Tax=Globodera rostochiensis TaxID=31243 RepID=A0A914GWU6_GLORO
MLLTIITSSTLLIVIYVRWTNAQSSGNALQIREVTGRARQPEARCAFSVHETGPEGPEIRDVTLDQELFYKIRCEAERGYCLRVSNCTVRAEDGSGQRGGGSASYPIIDGRGCTTEPSLFEHVQYEDYFTAGIFNPYPIRFRSKSTGVRFQCITSLMMLEKDGQCPRESCTWEGGPKMNKAVRRKVSRKLERVQ